MWYVLSPSWLDRGVSERLYKYFIPYGLIELQFFIFTFRWTWCKMAPGIALYLLICHSWRLCHTTHAWWYLTISICNISFCESSKLKKMDPRAALSDICHHLSTKRPSSHNCVAIVVLLAHDCAAGKAGTEMSAYVPFYQLISRYHLFLCYI